MRGNPHKHEEAYIHGAEPVLENESNLSLEREGKFKCTPGLTDPHRFEVFSFVLLKQHLEEYWISLGSSLIFD